MTSPSEREYCPNCYNPMPEEAAFCAHCGQKRIHDKDHSIWHLIRESFGDFFHLDSKFISTLKPLLFRPGFLTTEFLAGRRKKYFEPFKLFLFISFLYFLTSGIMKHYRETDKYEHSPTVKKADTISKGSEYKGLKFNLEDKYEKPIAIPDDSLRKLVEKEGLNSFVHKTYPGASWYTRFTIKRVIKSRLEGVQNFWGNMQKTVPKLIFILIPVFALLLKLLFLRRKIPYFNHIIFSIHFLSFFFLLIWFKEFTVLISKYISLAIYFLLIFYLFIALKRVYRDAYLKTSLKFILLFLSSLLVILIFFIIAGMISFAMI